MSLRVLRHRLHLISTKSTIRYKSTIKSNTQQSASTTTTTQAGVIGEVLGHALNLGQAWVGMCCTSRLCYIISHIFAC